MAESTIHPIHAANLVAKADRLKRYISRHCGVFATAKDVERLDDEQWGRIQELAGEARPISRETRAACVALFGSAEQDRAEHADPFDFAS